MNIQEIYNLIVESTGEGFTGAGIILVTKKGKVLALKKQNGSWGLPGGKPEEGETPEEAAIRETKEETGIAVPKLIIKPITLKYNHKLYYSFIHIVENKIEVHLSKEHKDYDWVHLSEFKKMKLIPPFRENFNQIANEIKKQLAKY